MSEIAFSVPFPVPQQEPRALPNISQPWVPFFEPVRPNGWFVVILLLFWQCGKAVQTNLFQVFVPEYQTDIQLVCIIWNYFALEVYARNWQIHWRGNNILVKLRNKFTFENYYFIVHLKTNISLSSHWPWTHTGIFWTGSGRFLFIKRIKSSNEWVICSQRNHSFISDCH